MERNLNRHRTYMRKLFKLIESKGYTIECECEDFEITKDEAIYQVDDAVIYVMDKEGYSKGWILFSFWNDWDESISDYIASLDETIGLDNFIKTETN